MNYNGESLYKNMISGSISGVLSLTAMYPTEYVKTKMQMGNLGNFWTILKKEVMGIGIRGIYGGYFPILISIIPRAGLNYGLYEYSYVRYKGMGIERNMSNIMAGLTSGAIAGLVLATPVENMKVSRINGIGVEKLYRSEGMGGFLKGFSPTVLKESTTYGSRFFIYTTFYEMMYEKTSNVFGSSLVASSMAGFISSYINNPVDVIQTRKQMPKGHGLPMTLKDIVREEGIGTLYRGVMIRSVRTIPSAIISFMSYEYICKYIFGL